MSGYASLSAVFKNCRVWTETKLIGAWYTWVGFVGNIFTRSAVSSPFPFPWGTSHVSFFLAVQITQRRSSSHLPVGSGHCCHLSGDQVGGKGLGEYLCACVHPILVFITEPLPHKLCWVPHSETYILYFAENIFSVYLCIFCHDGRGAVTLLYRVGAWSGESSYFLKEVQQILFILAHPIHCSLLPVMPPGPFGNSVV